MIVTKTAIKQTTRPSWHSRHAVLSSEKRPSSKRLIRMSKACSSSVKAWDLQNLQLVTTTHLWTNQLSRENLPYKTVGKQRLKSHWSLTLREKTLIKVEVLWKSSSEDQRQKSLKRTFSDRTKISRSDPLLWVSTGKRVKLTKCSTSNTSRIITIRCFWCKSITKKACSMSAFR